LDIFSLFKNVYWKFLIKILRRESKQKVRQQLGNNNYFQEILFYSITYEGVS